MRYMKCTYCGIIETTDTLRLDADESGYCPNCHMTQFFREHEHKPCCSAATTLQQLEELLEKNGTVTISRMWANFGIRVHTKNTTGDAKDLPAAIAAAYAAKEE